jgi:folate-binding Fe-S cluster repair protein YgfZ
MLNLDLIGAVSFEKGCYTGQEVIARAHFRGQVKRRMLRFLTQTETLLVPGKMVRLPDGRQAQVVRTAATGYGGQEFLAVTRFSVAASNASEESVNPDIPSIQASALPLPYALPD